MKTNVAQVGTEGRPVGTHQRPAAGTRGPGRCYGTGQPAVCRHGAVPIARRHAVVRLARAVRGLAGGAPAPFAVAQVGCLGAHLQDFVAGPEQRVPDDRFDHRSSPPAQLRGKRAAPETQAIGRSRAGLSTKIHTTVGALGNPTGFHLTPGQAHDLEGADVLLKDTAAATVLADKADDAQARVVELPLTAGKTIVMALRATRTDPRDDDRHLYQARPLIENFFARLKQYCCIATRHDKTTRIFLGAVHLASAMAWLN